MSLPYNIRLFIKEEIARQLKDCNGQPPCLDTGLGAPLVRDGIDGLDAYELAQAEGFTGTRAEWLASLGGLGTLDRLVRYIDSHFEVFEDDNWIPIPGPSTPSPSPTPTQSTGQGAEFPLSFPFGF